MFGTMYIGATGVTAEARWMDAIGNNLANSETIGFKRGQTFFETLSSKWMADGKRTDGGPAFGSQLGLGVAVSDIRGDFRQGSFQNGTAATDMAIAGQGFFGVKAKDGSIHYTRAGNFRFNADGQLVDPGGRQVQGYTTDPVTGRAGSALGGISLPMVTEMQNGVAQKVVKSPAKATSLVSLVANLNSAAKDKCGDASDPYFAMAKRWNGTADPPLGASQYGYQTAVNVYDASGGRHTLTVYFDKVASSGGGQQRYEFVVAMPAGEDGRSAFKGTSSAGLLACGTLTFGPNGALVNESLYTYDGSGDPKSLSNWALGAMGAGGVPQISLTYGSGGGSQTLGLDFGLHAAKGAWSAPAGTTAAAVGTGAGLAGMGQPTLQALSTTAYGSADATISSLQDGYAKGYLFNLGVDQQGNVVGEFSNGTHQSFGQVALYDFTNEFGLRREGGNLFSATPGAGKVITGKADSQEFGRIYGRSLETSNVDMATEFAHMILSQRGYQANTKVITTADAMLNSLLQTKR